MLEIVHRGPETGFPQYGVDGGSVYALGDGIGGACLHGPYSSVVQENAPHESGGARSSQLFSYGDAQPHPLGENSSRPSKTSAIGWPGPREQRLGWLLAAQPRQQLIP